VERGAVADELLALVRETSTAGLEGLKSLAEANVSRTGSTSKTIMLTGLAVALVMGILLAVFITRSITRPINVVIAG
jgi:methyl-accepting chemotaxis protein